MQALATYQTGATPASKSMRRYYPTGTALARAGISWCNTDEYEDVFVNSNLEARDAYNAQLPSGAGSSSIIRLNFQPQTELGQTLPVAKLQVTYYVQYRGTKGAQAPIRGPDEASPNLSDQAFMK